MRAFCILLLTISMCVAADNAENLLDNGIEAFHKGNYVEAQKLFERAMKLSPADARAITYLAIMNASRGNCTEWLDELKLQASRNPDIEIRKLAALAFIQCELPHNQFGEIMPVLQQLRMKFPDDPDVIYEAAKVYNRAWNHSIYELFAKGQSSFRVNQMSAEILETQGKYGEAAAEYRKAIEKDPRVLTLHYGLGRTILLQSHEAEAQEQARMAFEAELKLNPDDAVAEYQLGLIDQNSKKPTAAIGHFEKALRLAPNFAEALVALGKMRLDANESAEAVSLLERAVRAQPAMPAAHYNLMLAYRESGKKKEAQREEKALDKLRKPQDGEMSDFLKKLGDRAQSQP